MSISSGLLRSRGGSYLAYRAAQLDKGTSG
jgi:hypothetical protein